MTCNDMEPVRKDVEGPEPLVLSGNLADIARLPPWVDAVAARYGMSEHATFASQLCLEEAVSNVMRHGYGNQDGQFLTISCEQTGEGFFVFTVEDDAAPFNPLEAAALPTIGEQDAGMLGGQGIRLMRGFANLLEYEAKVGGNRLRIGFSNASPV
jgi:anti-sigma regulatory factor (Ser/Thr protein kinase)